MGKAFLPYVLVVLKYVAFGFTSLEPRTITILQYGTPIRVVEMGTTEVDQETFDQYLEDINPRFTAENVSAYPLCATFVWH